MKLLTNLLRILDSFNLLLVQLIVGRKNTIDE